MKTINRKSLLYKKEVEYDLLYNPHIQVSARGCKFPCYAMMMAKRLGKGKTIPRVKWTCNQGKRNCAKSKKGNEVYGSFQRGHES